MGGAFQMATSLKAGTGVLFGAATEVAAKFRHRRNLHWPGGGIDSDTVGGALVGLTRSTISRQKWFEKL